jgi:plastocyanin
MILRRGRVAALACVGLVSTLLVVPTMTAVARAATKTIAIAIDHGTPPGHDFEYVDFFPRSGVAIHTGDVIDFGWSATLDGLHTATLLKTGETPAHAWATHILAASDADDGAAQLQLNPTIGGPTHPPAGSGAPGACGSASAPCVYNGTADLNSGANPSDGKTHFFVKVNVPAGTTVNVVCLIHPGMAASFDVVGAGAAASTPSAVASAAASQATADTTAAMAAMNAASTPQIVTNANGTHTVTLTAGTATDHVEVVEMLPSTATVTAGDTVRWITKTIKDIHTVTFPQGHDPSTEPLPSNCEGTPDVLQTGPPAGPPCGDPSKFENHFNAAPVGGTVIPTPVTLASSGIIANPPAPFPTSYSVTFPNAGTFTYQCRIHDHMTGTLTVLSSAATPISTTPQLTG